MITIKQSCDEIKLDPKKFTKIYCEHGGDPNNSIMLDTMVYYFPCAKCWHALLGEVIADLIGNTATRMVKTGNLGLFTIVNNIDREDLHGGGVPGKR